MKEFIMELLDMCSASNEKSRGFYIFITIGLAALCLLTVVSVILNIVMLIKGWWTPLYIILLLASLVMLVGIVVWLKKSN